MAAIPKPTNPSPRQCLLIVEDDEDMRTQMKWALSEDYEVFPAGDRKTERLYHPTQW